MEISKCYKSGPFYSPVSFKSQCTSTPSPLPPPPTAHTINLARALPLPPSWRVSEPPPHSRLAELGDPLRLTFKDGGNRYLCIVGSGSIMSKWELKRSYKFETYREELCVDL